MSKTSYLLVYLTFLFLGSPHLHASQFPEKSGKPEVEWNTITLHRYANHPDSIHRVDFRYRDKPRGLKPWIAPAVLITTGSALAFADDVRHNLGSYVRTNFEYNGHLDDVIQYAPLAAVYALDFSGIKAKNNFGNRTVLAAKGVLIRQLIVSSLKGWTKVERPNGDMRSFPSGHSSFAFAMAHFMHREYGEQSTWYSIGAYTCATSVAFMRMAKNAHWVSDVVAGAGIGIFSTELAYLTHQYKWDNEHLRNWDILPFSTGKQNGVALVYHF